VALASWLVSYVGLLLDMICYPLALIEGAVMKLDRPSVKAAARPVSSGSAVSITSFARKP
jgi:hypothetical protein